MDCSNSQDMVAHAPTANARRKRPGSPITAEVRCSKLPQHWSSRCAPYSQSSERSFPSIPPSRPDLDLNFPLSVVGQAGTHARRPPGVVENCFVSVHSYQTGSADDILPHSPATQISPYLPLASGTTPVPLGPLSADLHDHTLPCTPSLRDISVVDPSPLPRIPDRTQLLPQSMAAYRHSQTQVPASNDTQWPVGLSLPSSSSLLISSDTHSNPGLSDYVMAPYPPLHQDGSPTTQYPSYTFPTSAMPAYTTSALPAYTTSVMPAYTTSALPDQTSYSYLDPDLPNGYSSVSTLHYRQDDATSRQRSAPHTDMDRDTRYSRYCAGPYVRVVGRQDGSPERVAEYSDIEETVTADEEELARTMEDVDGLPRDAVLVRNAPYASSSLNSSYVDITRPDNQSTEELVQHAPSSENGAAATVRNPEDLAANNIVDNTDPIAAANQATRRKQRSQFSDRKREETNLTRKMGACHRCRQQRIRCTADPSRPGDPKAPCLTCQQVSPKSKKVVHHLQCGRYNLTSIVLYRPGGGLKFTKRWEGSRVKDVGDWADNKIRIIYVEQGLSRTPSKLLVRKFIPKDGDVLHRTWNDNGTRRHQVLEPYCLADVERAAQDFKAYLDKNALHGLRLAVESSDELVVRTYEMIAKHYASLPDEVEVGKSGQTKANMEKKFLLRMIRLWFAIRHMSGSAWISGEDKLDMELLADPSHPLQGRVSLPRMIVAQMDSIQNERILRDLGKTVLRDLNQFFQSSNPKTWFTVYLAVFMLLHETSHASKDRRRWALQNGYRARYGPNELGLFVERLQEGANVVLAHWQYFKCDEPKNVDWANRKKTRLKSLTQDQAGFIQRSVEMIKEKEPSIPQTPEEGCWEHDLYWVSKMFDTWEPLNTFTHMER